MKCENKIIAPWQALIKGTLLFQKEEFVGQKNFRIYKMWILSGPGEYQQYFELELKRDVEDKYKDLQDGVEVEALCWVNGKLWNERCFTSLNLIHLEVVRTTEEISEEDNINDLSSLGENDDLGDEEDFPF